MGKKVPHTFENIGQELKARRVKRGESLAHVSNTTRIPVPHLQAIEALDKDNLPAMGYALGYLRSYAKEMGVSGSEAVKRFKADLAGKDAVLAQVRTHQGPKPSIKPRPMALPKGLFSGLAVSLFAGSLALWFGVQADDIAEASLTVSPAQSYEVREKVILPDDIYRLTAIQPSLVEIRRLDGEVLVRRIFTPGQTWEGAADADLIISARNGSAINLERGEQDFGVLSQFGEAVEPISLNALEFRLSYKTASQAPTETAALLPDL